MLAAECRANEGQWSDKGTFEMDSVTSTQTTGGIAVGNDRSNSRVSHEIKTLPMPIRTLVPYICDINFASMVSTKMRLVNLDCTFEYF